ncbi:hypothetical protein ACFL27_01150 [candidate division CSSED10-310 bacterium]|uniref:Uncharacterized protein n=1 Tax=candidate division CSSED10-310 bacterium TaxID=2855610 RepID=A0ABV6YRU2_UNCC1
MTREQIIHYLERNLKELGKREYTICFQSLDDTSLSELVDFFRHISAQIDHSGKNRSHISNRCVHLCLERRSDRETNSEQTLLCRKVSLSEEPCLYQHDTDAKHMCNNYHIEE